MSVSGSYVLEKNENFETFLKACGAKDERIQKMAAARPNVDITLSGDKLTITHTGDVENTNVVTLGAPSNITIGGSIDLIINFTLSGTSGKGTITKGGKSGEFTADFGATHLTETFTFGDLTCKRIYKRK